MQTRSSRWMAVVSACVAMGASNLALGGGITLPTRGVRPTARAGAFVAGADDLHALWFNPAGLVAAPPSKKKLSFLFDVGYVDQSVDYTRIDSGNNRLPTVQDQAPGNPIPTLAIGYRVSDRLALAAGIFAPYASAQKYAADGPARYSIIDTTETVPLIFEAAVGYRVSDRLRIGAGLQNMVFQIASTVVFSGCPQEVTCAPEDREFDSLNKISQLSLFVPSGVIGAQLDLGPKATVGASFQFPFVITGSGELQSALPSSGFYDGATLVGDRADLSLTLAPILRAGIEFRPSPLARIEIAGRIEFWSVHDKYTIEPRNVRIENAPGLGTYEFSTVEVIRNFKNSFAVAVGGEVKPGAKSPLTVLAGYAYETSAVQDEYLSVLTVDANKHLFSGGLGYRVGGWQAHATIAIARLSDRTVTPEVGRAPQLTPLRTPDDVEPVTTYVNWGDYKSSWIVAGVGASTQF